MKKPAVFTDAEAAIIEKLLSMRINTIDTIKSMALIDNERPNCKIADQYIKALNARSKIWAQLHGTCAADVEGI
ncbi:hypothetical protein LG288_05855 [Idiomarina seosinensis]|uniref:hypothetical protein n=1 Tax=Idiomarina seosinensis TaxID=281739 RepID=UPI00384F05EA